MKSIGKVAEFLKKAARALRARLLFLASLRRRTAMVGAISRHVRSLMPGHEKAAGGGRGRGMAVLATADDVDEQLALSGLRNGDVGLSELASLFQEVDDGHGQGGAGGVPDWTHSLFDDDAIDDDEVGDVDQVMEELGDDEPSVMDVIRSRREGEGEEFNMEEEIDHAADMFIQRVRSRMTQHAGVSS